MNLTQGKQYGFLRSCCFFSYSEKCFDTEVLFLSYFYPEAKGVFRHCGVDHILARPKIWKKRSHSTREGRQSRLTPPSCRGRLLPPFGVVRILIEFDRSALWRSNGVCCATPTVCLLRKYAVSCRRRLAARRLRNFSQA